jgi:hypothetical protein
VAITIVAAAMPTTLVGTVPKKHVHTDAVAQNVLVAVCVIVELARATAVTDTRALRANASPARTTAAGKAHVTRPPDYATVPVDTPATTATRAYAQRGMIH